MRRGIGKTTWIAFAAIGGLLAAYLILLMLGTVIVYDPGNQVVSAAIVGGNGTTQPMHRAPGGFFVAIPRIEGEVGIRCRDGSVDHGGYVTPHMEQRLTVAGACRIETR